MAKLHYSRYQLTFRHAPITRVGAILRLTEKDGSVGYADIHPWVELGDLPLNKLLQALKKGLLTTLTKQTLMFAELDRKARKKNINLLQEKEIPKSHTLLMNAKETIDLEKVTHLKVKGLGPFHFPKSVHLRLDLNSCLTEDAFEAFLKELPLDQLEFIEDPYPYASSWKEMQSKYNVKFARDYRSEEGGVASTLIVKPAVQRIDSFLKGDHSLVVTSYLDHPLGQLSAAYQAATLQEKTSRVGVCGLMSHTVYETNRFSEQLEEKESVLQPVSGTGFGFDKELESLNWSPLIDEFDKTKYIWYNNRNWMSNAL